MDMRPHWSPKRKMTSSNLPENRLMTPDTPSPNPLLADWCGPYGLPPFASVQPSHFLPAFDVALPAHLAEIDAIAHHPGPASFANTLQAVEREMAPRQAAHHNAICRVCAGTPRRSGPDRTAPVRAGCRPSGGHAAGLARGALCDHPVTVFGRAFFDLFGAAWPARDPVAGPGGARGADGCARQPAGGRSHHGGHVLHHPDARLWEVRGPGDALVGLFLGDNYARATKRSGAWMSVFRSQSGHAGGTLPIVINN